MSSIEIFLLVVAVIQAFIIGYLLQENRFNKRRSDFWDVEYDSLRGMYYQTIDTVLLPKKKRKRKK